MNISQIFIQRPIATILLMLGLLLFGIMGYRALPISDLPNVDFPTIVVFASLPGASPETMATAVATPLERQFSTIAGIDTMSSTSSLGSTQITLQFSLDRNIDSAALDVQSAISVANRQLPTDMPSPPTYIKVNPAAAPILYLALTSSTLPLSTVDRYAETFLAQRISMVNGVAQVSVYGAQKYAVRAQLNPDKLASYGIGVDEVVQAIQQGNVNLPSGTLNGPKQTYFIQTAGQLTNADAFRKLIVTFRDGAPVYLGSLGNIIDSVENTRVASWFNNQRGIVLAIQRQPGTNTIAVVNGIRNILPHFEKQLPPGIKLTVLYDRSQSIRASVDEVQFTLILAGILVVLVIFSFLRSFAATFIPGIALPLSIIGTFGVMHLYDFSLDNLSLLALTLIVGFVIDDAIVMLENIFRHIEKGENAMTAALNGSKEISFTILSMTLSLAIVFVPILFMGGLVGRLMHEFSMTIVIAILFSGFISLTLTPMLCSRLLRAHSIEESKPHRFKIFDRIGFATWKNIYEKSLRWTLDHKPVMLGIFFLSIVLLGVLFVVVPKGFLPNEDTGQIIGFTEADPQVSFEEMSKRQQIVADIILKNPNIQSVMSVIGAGGATSTTNSGRVFVKLKPFDERREKADDIIQSLQKKLKQVPGITVYLQNIPTISVGRLTKGTFQYTLQDTDVKELNKWSEIFKTEIAKLPGLQEVTSDLTFTGPQVHIKINRDKASALGITAAQIENSLNNAFGTRQISTIYTPIDYYEVIVELEPGAQTDPNSLLRLYIRASNGKLIPLSTVASIEQGTGPLTVNHQGQIPAVTISFNLKPGASLGTAVNQIERLKNKLNPPESLIGSFQGTAQAFQSSSQGLGLLLLLSIFAIYILLGMLYESFIHPLTILSGLPVAGVGAILALALFHMDLNFYSFIGIIMLVGIVKKNAIMMIDFALDAQRNEKMLPHDAIYSACLVRFRPIMMTTVAALMGTLPIALSFGVGSEGRRPLGVAVVGGLLLSQLLTLYITPVIYLYFESLSQKASGKWKKIFGK